MISVIIPAYNEGACLNECLESVHKAIGNSGVCVEVIVVINDPSIGRVQAKNIGAERAIGNILVFLDADCRISENFFQEIDKKAKNPFFIGGGVKYVKLDKYSIGIFAFYICLGFYLLLKQITVGAFWIRKEVFKAIGGFKEERFDDIDFALRMKQYASDNNKKFESLKESHIIWSTRKFKDWGDWHWIKGYKTERLGN